MHIICTAACFAFLMLMCSAAPTSPLQRISSFQFLLFIASVFLYLSLSSNLCPPHPTPPLSAAMLPCLPLGEEMRRGADANILDPSLLPDSSPRDRNKDGVSEERGGGGGGGGQENRRTADWFAVKKQRKWLATVYY